MSTSAQGLPALTTTVERRFYSRIVPHAPIFVCMDGINQSLLLNVSENGLLLSTPTEVICNFVARTAIPLNGLPKPVEVNVRVVWASKARKLAGIQLLDLSEHDREQIRKWCAHSSTQSLQPEPDHPQIVVMTSPISHDRTNSTPSFTEKAPFHSLRAVAPLAPSPIARRRSTSTLAGIVTLGVFLGTVCIAGVFFLKDGSPRIPVALSTENRDQSSAATTPAQKIPGNQQNQEPLEREAVSIVASPVPSVHAAKAKRVLSDTLSRNNSAQAGDDASHEPDTEGSAPDTRENTPTPDTSRLRTEHRAGSRPDPSMNGTNPAVTDAAPKSSGTGANSSAPANVAPATLPASPYPQVAKEPARNPPRPSNLATGTATTISSGPIATPTHPAPTRQSDTSVIQMDAPARQVMVIQLPRGYHAPFFSFPDERILESPSATMHIRRSIRMPVTHVGWPFNRNKKVILGGLISRVDPQVAQVQIGPDELVRVSATVAANGRIENVTPIQGPANLVRAVVKAVREWRYHPTLLDGKQIETQCYVLVQFHAAVGSSARQ